MPRVTNFSAGPAALPDDVLAQIRDDLPDWDGTGMSVMEVSHRGKDFIALAERCEQNLRRLLNISDDYAVLWIQGGATMQMAMAPLNLTQAGDTADYVITGSWGKKAANEAKKFCTVNLAADATDDGFSGIPAIDTWQRTDGAAYLHITSNETIVGVEFPDAPQSDVPIVADMSSNILSRPINVNDYGVIYAGAQKNIGPSGITLVIVRKDLLSPKRTDLPHLMMWQSYADSDSMTNTPPTFAWYVADLVFQWLLEQGGVAAIGEINRRKAEKLYSAIDTSDFFSNPVEPAYRSRMNVPFVLADDALDSVFLEETHAAGLCNLKGHRLVGGMRASIYNAVPEHGVDKLIEFMKDFEQRHG